MAEDADSPAAREASGPPAPGAHPREGKLALTRPGQYVAYIEDRARKYCTVGEVATGVKADEAIAVHRRRPVMDGHLRVKLSPPCYATAEDGGQGQLEGVRLCFQNVAATDVLSVVVLREGGIMGHAVARRLDLSLIHISEPTRLALI
eukprot:9551927-Alexandrium_andersonii.AAC.1